LKKHTAFFFRHGKTDYTGRAQDLTSEGVRQVTLAAQDIASRIGGAIIRMSSSPTPRALTSADVAAEILKFDPMEIRLEPALRCVDFYSRWATELPWKNLPIDGPIELEYPTHPYFDTGEHFERRTDVKKRFAAHLEELLLNFNAGQLPDVSVSTSHFEVLHPMIRCLGQEKPLGNAEVISLELAQEASHQKILIKLTFRDVVHSFPIRPPFDSFRYPLGLAD
jgi:broad specificity phosphatase PhoE